jgi:hypothetical protein
MKKLFGLLVALLAAIGAVATVVVLGRKNQWSSGSMWKSAKNSTSSWADTAAEGASKAAGTVSAAASDAADAASSMADQATDALKRATTDT